MNSLHLHLVFFSSPCVREVKSCYEEMDKLAVDTTPEHTLCYELRHKVLPASCPTVECHDQSFPRLLVLLVTSERPDHQLSGNVLSHQMLVKKLEWSRPSGEIFSNNQMFTCSSLV